MAGWQLAGFLALLPVANLLPLELGGGAFIAERFLLFPMVFFALAAGNLIEWSMPIAKTVVLGTRGPLAGVFACHDPTYTPELAG